MNPFYTIVIPTFNHAPLLKKALDSVLSQSFSDWEAIVIDNCSDDNTAEVIAGYIDPRISYFQIQNHGVIAASRNLGIRHAKGSWIAFLDSDDVWLPTRLNKLYEFIKKFEKIDVWSTNEVLVNLNTGQKKNIKYGPNSNNMYQKLLKYGNCLSPSAAIVKKSFLYKNRIYMRENYEYITAEDFDFWLLLAHSGAKFKFLNCIEGQYTVHSANNSTQINRHENAIRNVLHDHVFHIQIFEEKNTLWKKIEVRILVEKYLRRLSSGGGYLSGAHGLLKAFFSSPYSFSLSLAYLLYIKIR